MYAENALFILSRFRLNIEYLTATNLFILFFFLVQIHLVCMSVGAMCGCSLNVVIYKFERNFSAAESNIRLRIHIYNTIYYFSFSLFVLSLLSYVSATIHINLSEKTKKRTMGNKAILSEDMWEKLEQEALRIGCGSSMNAVKILLTHFQRNDYDDKRWQSLTRRIKKKFVLLVMAQELRNILARANQRVANDETQAEPANVNGELQNGHTKQTTFSIETFFFLSHSSQMTSTISKRWYESPTYASWMHRSLIVVVPDTRSG